MKWTLDYKPFKITQKTLLRKLMKKRTACKNGTLVMQSDFGQWEEMLESMD